MRVSDIRKKDFGIGSRPVYMHLLVDPEWLHGSPGFENGEELGGYAGADPKATLAWWRQRLERLRLIEVRGRIKLAEEDVVANEADGEDAPEEATSDGEVAQESDHKKYGLPREIVLADGRRISTRIGTIPEQAKFRCEASTCGREQAIKEALEHSTHTAPVAVSVLQCHCPECEAEGFNYGGRYFKVVDDADLRRLYRAEAEWSVRSATDLEHYWPREPLVYAHMTHQRQPLPQHGYTHWWKMFSSRQLLVHAQLLRTITDAPEDRWPLDVREQALGALQQYLRNQCMFAFWHRANDVPVPHFSNDNYHPKQTTIENNLVGAVGYGNWTSCTQGVLDALTSVRHPWESFQEHGQTKAVKVYPGDSVLQGSADICCHSATDLASLEQTSFDLVITDPPFGNNVFYADLADFFYMWLRIPLLRWYEEMPERAYFEPLRTPHSVEAVENPVEHPDDREEWEKEAYLSKNWLARVCELTGNAELSQKDPNPLFRPEPAADFYRQTLTACWSEAARLLKPGGVLAFTFHHSAAEPWLGVLQSLFDAGLVLSATYPVRSDNTKGENASFGSKKIEYDIIHVCRKRLNAPQPVSWAKMRRWVKEETEHLKDLLEHSHGKALPDEDLRVILRGKALEFYSRHYGQVYTGDGQLLSVRDALLGINQILDDLLQTSGAQGVLRPPDAAEPASGLFLRLFQGRESMTRDQLHKTLGGTGVAPDDLEARRWIRTIGTTVHVVPMSERFIFFTSPGRNRKVLRTDLDQANFLIGAALPGSGIDISRELERDSFTLKRSVDAILDWYAQTDTHPEIRQAAGLALSLVTHWRNRPTKKPESAQLSLFEQLEAQDA